MPQVDITVVGDAPSAEQKRALFEGVTNLMVDVLGRPRKLVVVSVARADPSDWAVGGASPSGPGPGVVGVQAVVRIVAGTNSDDQKSRMIAETTKVLRDVLGNSVLPLYVTFEETPPASWGYDGRTVAEMRKASSSS